MRTSEEIISMVNNLPLGDTITEHKFNKCHVEFRTKENVTNILNFKEGSCEIDTVPSVGDVLVIHTMYDPYSDGLGIHIRRGLELPLDTISGISFNQMW